jgi:hypothetical protein
MILLTCSSYSADVYRLFDTFRQYNSTDKIIWILADKQPLSVSDTGLIKEYFGNMDIIYYYAKNGFWGALPCLQQPQWEAITQVAYTLSDNETILRCDGNDVVIQKLCTFGDIPDSHIYCGYEGMLYKDNNCCTGWFDTAKRETYKNSPVVNSGALVMNGKTFKTLSSEMAYGNNPGIYSDQNLLQWVCDKLNIKLINNPEILAVYNNKYHINNDKLHHNSKIVTIAHFNGRHMFEHLKNTMEKLFSTEKCLSIEKQILGYNL